MDVIGLYGGSLPSGGAHPGAVALAKAAAAAAAGHGNSSDEDSNRSVASSVGSDGGMTVTTNWTSRLNLGNGSVVVAVPATM